MATPANGTGPPQPSGKPGMEVEVKLRLADSASYASLCQVLLPCFRQAHEQENFCEPPRPAAARPPARLPACALRLSPPLPPARPAVFDGTAKELSSKRCVLRVRFYNKDRKAVITVKGKQVLADGIGTAPEQEEVVDPSLARTFLSNPQALLELDSPLLARVRREHAPAALLCLGGFDNLRSEYAWRGHVLEVDQTAYPWGTLHEVECETVRGERGWGGGGSWRGGSWRGGRRRLADCGVGIVQHTRADCRCSPLFGPLLTPLLTPTSRPHRRRRSPTRGRCAPSWRRSCRRTACSTRTRPSPSLPTLWTRRWSRGRPAAGARWRGPAGRAIHAV